VTAREGSYQSFLGVDVLGDAEWQSNGMRWRRSGYRSPAIEAPEMCSRIAAIKEGGTLGSFPLNCGVKLAHQIALSLRDT
jgi:hypothetical protein